MSSVKKNNHPSYLIPVYLRNGFVIAVSLLVWIFLIFSILPATPDLNPPPLPTTVCPEDTGLFYIYDLPPKFNHDLLLRCRSLNVYTNMCTYIANHGLGFPTHSAILSDQVNGSNWYATHQFIAEMIFHARLENHRCRTEDATQAEIFYAPFYTGLYASSVFRLSDLPERDRLALEFNEFIRQQSVFRRSGGEDHFLVTGRTAWDFMRKDNDNQEDFGANRLFMLPEIRKMTILTVERHPWEGNNQFGIPYPSYFHPWVSSDVSIWQEKVYKSRRTHLFSFVGGPRKGLEKAAVREQILLQCGKSNRCLRSKCEPGSVLCYEPGRVLDVMMKSEFCMQPPGDSFTRRSVFDSILAGCIPVFFSEHTAYTQYGWYLPGSREEYSVFVPKKKWGNIEEELSSVPEPVVRRLRTRVIELIPSLTYAHPNSTEPGFRDAVDVALVKLTQNVRQLTVREKTGRDQSRPGLRL